MRLAFLDLPDDRVDLISLARQTTGVEIALVCHPDPEALALKIAEVLQIPRSTEPLDLLALKPDRVALPAMDTPSAAALARAGISNRIFTTLDDLESTFIAGARADATGDPTPLENWEQLFDEATGTRLGKIQEALALSEDRQRLFREILALAVEQTRAEAGSIMVLDEEEGELRIAFADGLSPDTVRSTRQKLGEGVAGKVAQEGRPLIINERIADPRFRDTRERSRISAAMSAPIQLDGRVIGVINVSSNQPDRRFEEQDLARLTEIATQISAILERVIQGLRRDADAVEFRARRALEQAFAREDLPLAERFRIAATRLASHLDAESAHICIAEPEAGRFRVISSGTETGTEGRLPMTGGLYSRAYKNGESLFLASRLARPSDADAGEPAANMVVAPIGEARALGVLAIECMERIATDIEEHTRLVTRIASFLARLAGIHRDHGMATRQGILSGMLADIAPRLMVQHDLESLLTESLAALRELFGRGLVTVRLRNHDNGLLSRSAFAASETDRPVLSKIDEELTALALEQGTESSSIAGSATPDEVEGSRTEFAAVPIRSSDRIVGALGVAISSPPEARVGSLSLGSAELEAVRKLALYVALAWDQVRAEVCEAPSPHDPVTGLLGGAGLETRIQEEVKRAERYHDRILLTICSISGYERLERRHGPEWIESFVREFAQALAKNVREVDTVARIGGGRFAVLSPESDKDEGALLKRLDHLVPRLESVQSLPDADDIRLVGRQYSYPDEVSTGGELLALIRSSYPGA
ncbi:MAG TPA: GAF domain-containing protein [Candidatus Eisenbacteria bacterium]|nr:GAF domain-containing protein [Candidatus Eisenbacteria bacterium]